MTTQTEQPIECENVTLTLTSEEYDFLIGQIAGLVKVQSEMPRRFQIEQCNYIAFVSRFHKKLQFFSPNIGDACRHSAHIPEAPGQGGINDYCPECDDEGTIESFDSVIPCPYCSKGQGGNQ